MFIPEKMRPPKLAYDYTRRKRKPIYPKYVVWEAKHFSSLLDPNNPEQIKTRAERRLDMTQSGQQMGKNWIEKRIPNALRRGGMSKEDVKKKYQDIKSTRYARWMFLCSPLSPGSKQKLYVLLDMKHSNL